MKTKIIDLKTIKALVWGAAILGGGGGGSPEQGIIMGSMACKFGELNLLQIEELNPKDILVTISAVGAPASEGPLRPTNLIRAVKILKDHMDKPINGFIANECGGLAIVSSFIPAAIFGIPIIDVAVNGRAYPISVMGSMGLNSKPGYRSCQGICGGNRREGTDVEAYLEGTVENVSYLVRQSAVTSKGLVAVARNPVDAEHVQKHAAIGAFSTAINIGNLLLKIIDSDKKSYKAIEAVANFMCGKVIKIGVIDKVQLQTKNGFDVGIVKIKDYELTFLNEYMTLEKKGKRIATFPDLITIFDYNTGFPVNSAEIKSGMKIVVLVVPQEYLLLDIGIKDKKNYKFLSHVTGKDI